MPHQHQVAAGIFQLAKQGIDDTTSGVVDRQQQCELGPIFSQPSVVAAVYLYQHSLASHPLPSNTMLRRPATTRTVHTGVSQYLAQRVTTDVYALSLPQQLAQVRVVDSHVSGPRQDHHLRRQRVRCSVGRSATSIAVGEWGCAVLSVSRQSTPGVARAQSHQCRCLL